MNVNFLRYLLVSACLLTQACDTFLDEKSDKKLVLPDNAANLQALLDNASAVNNSFCSANEIASGDFYLSDENFSSQREDYQKQYTWDPGQQFLDVSVNSGTDWQNTYRGVYLCSSIIQALKGKQAEGLANAENQVVLGQAMAIRAYRYLDAALIWAPAYDMESAGIDLGIPLRNDPDFNLPTVRSSVEETYQQIIADAAASIPLLPVVNINAYRASKPFAYAVLARTYLAMRQYEKAGLYADSCLALQSVLINFGTIDNASMSPFEAINTETIFFAAIARTVCLNNSVARIEAAFVESYHENDLRKQLFFTKNSDETYQFKGTYTGATNQFAGISTAEVYLIKAECDARKGNLADALNTINRLLVTRYQEGSYIPFATESQEELLKLILSERHKELLMRGLRWLDLKRLNKEGANIQLSRVVKGRHYELQPNDKRYALPIPDDVIRMTGISPNPR